jgi:hypothetical protein
MLIRLGVYMMVWRVVLQALKSKFKELTGEDWGGAPQDASKKKKVRQSHQHCQVSRARL